MDIYIALLRGINVGGHNKIKMSELKRALEAMGLAKVQTYIQSGNVVFAADGMAEQLQSAIEAEILRVFGLTVAVIIRTHEELKSIIQDCPYSTASLSEGESIHVAFMTEAPTLEALTRVNTINCPPDEFQIKGREVYLLFRQSIRDSKLPNQLQKLGLPATSRNWNTVTKLAAMADTFEV